MSQQEREFGDFEQNRCSDMAKGKKRQIWPLVASERQRKDLSLGGNVKKEFTTALGQ